MSATAPRAFPEPSIEPPGVRARRLNQEAREAADEDVALLLERLATAERQAADIAQSGANYPAGYREEARQIAEAIQGALDRFQSVRNAVERTRA